MQKSSGQKIVIIGCGNVAWHIAKKLNSLGQFEVFVYNHRQNALLDSFRTKLKCRVHHSLDHILPDAAFYFICVDDKHIAGTAKKINSTNPGAVILHTSGSVKLEVLGQRVHGTAVFYPLQTFSINDTVNWDDIPVIIEALPGYSAGTVKLARQFSKTVLLLDGEQRLKLHLAAVLVNNFPNALYQAASELLVSDAKNKHVNFDLLLPLIVQTTNKVTRLDPSEAQTGPAKRKDKQVLKKHLGLLTKHPDLEKIYKQMTKLIVKQQSRKHA